MTPTQRAVLEWIARTELSGTTPTQAGLGRAMGWRSAATSWETVSRLEDHGLVLRLYGTDEIAYSRGLTLSAKGWAALQDDGSTASQQATLAVLRRLELEASNQDLAAIERVTRLLLQHVETTGEFSGKEGER